MRTVSFSDPEVQRLLSGHFVCTYSNTQGDPAAGMSIPHAPADPPGTCIRGNGKQNVQTIFLTPQGEIFHVATGFLSETDLAVEIRFAGDLFAELNDPSKTPRDTVIAAHRNRLRELGLEDGQIERGSSFESGLGISGFANFIGGTRARRQPDPLDRLASMMNNPMETMIRDQVVGDQQFCIRFPLMTWQSLEKDPTRLVGNGKSFFASSSHGSSGR